MKRNTLLSWVMIFIISIVTLTGGVSYNVVVAQSGQNVSVMVPNDPARDVKADDLHDLSAGYGWQDWLESHSAEGIEDIVIVVGDTGGNHCGDNLQIKSQCLLSLAKNLTDDPDFSDNNTHIFSVIAAIAALVNDGKSTAGPAGYRGRVGIVPDKAARSDGSTKSDFHRNLYQHALDLKASGVNVRIVLVASGTLGDSNSEASLKLIRQMASQKIVLMASAGVNGVNLDQALTKIYPAAYGATEPNVIAVAATDATGNALEPSSPFGPKTVRWAALGRNLQVPDPEDTTNYTNTASFSGTSPAAALNTAILAITLAYRSHVLAKAKRRVDSSCVVVPGVGFGRPRLGESLKDKPVTLLEAMESANFLVDSWSKNFSLFSLDGRSRVMLLIENVDNPLTAGELVVTFTDSKNQVLAVSPENIEFVGEVTGQEWITQVVLQAPAGLAPGSVKINLTARGTTSSLAKNIL